MGWLERMGLVEHEDPMTPVVTETMPELEADVDITINSVVNIVENIYEQNGLSDKSNSIYTVQALMETLPAEMTTAKKQGTVAGILRVSGQSVVDLLHDAQYRIDTLCAARDQIVKDRTNEITIANGDIEELKNAIESATIKIREAEDIIEATKKSVGDEISMVDDLVKFCEGMSDK